MKKYILMLIITTLLSILAFSQDNYPKVIVSDNDTLVIITQIQLEKTNKLFIDRLKYIEYKDSLDNQINIAQGALFKQDEINNNLHTEIVLLESTKCDLEKIIEINNCNLSYKDSQLKQQKKHKYGIAGIAILLLIIL